MDNPEWHNSVQHGVASNCAMRWCHVLTNEGAHPAVWDRGRELDGNPVWVLWIEGYLRRRDDS